jgi:hypothetical protein
MLGYWWPRGLLFGWLFDPVLFPGPWFDTPAASVAFYIYLGLASCLWMKTDRQPATQKKPAQTGFWGTLVVALTALTSLYCVFVSDGVTADVLRNINYAINARNAQLAKDILTRQMRSRLFTTEVNYVHGVWSLPVSCCNTPKVKRT